jgi:hypothetical protein
MRSKASLFWIARSTRRMMTGVSLLAFCFSASGCTLKVSQKSHSIKLRFSRQNAQELSRELSRRLAHSRSLLPSNASKELKFELEDFSCFGIQVSGEGISGDSRLGCSSNSGILGGMVPAAGGEIEVAVPAGRARKVQIFALRSVVGCPNWDDVMKAPVETRYNGIDKPYEIASTTVDIFSDVTVQVQAKYDPAAPVALFPGCQVGQADYGHPKLSKSEIAWFTGGSASGKPTNCQSNTGRPCFSGFYALDPYTVAGGIAGVPAAPMAIQKYKLNYARFSMGPEE